jgi:hypothetical protein
MSVALRLLPTNIVEVAAMHLIHLLTVTILLISLLFTGLSIFAVELTLCKK